MAEPQKQQMGDGSDNIGQAAGQAAKAAKNAGKQAAKQAAKKGAEATANAAAATVKAGVEGGKAVAEIAAGTAAGGPWGAIISAAWAMRHTLFKILVCLCLSVVFLIVMIVELPGIIINKALGIDGNEPTVSITEIYENLSETVSDIVQAGYDASMKYIVVVPRIDMVSTVRLPNAPCLFATVDFCGQDEPEVRFYSEEATEHEG